MSNEKENPFKENRRSKFRRALGAESYSALANTLFGELVDSYMDYFSDLRGDLEKANINVLFRTYVSEVFLNTVLASLTSFLMLITLIMILRPSTLIFQILMVVNIPIIVGIVVFMFSYYYPQHKASSRAGNIENNLPFALNQIAAVASSGIPPSRMFKLLTDFEEYEEISEEAQKVVKKVDVFGEDITTALRELASETPSEDFKEVLYGMISTIETGGNLNQFLQEQSESALDDYRMRRRKEIEKLSTFASFYTAILVAAPLFLIAILSVLNMVGGGLMGYDIGTLMKVGVYAFIPVINFLFIAVLQIVQGEI
ncbi:MAG: type II secretion system F family protein [Candidatus Nanohaloarchaeota archaeon QJJ-9]|nr:type II secretion system F family protein [Candidatus Nanohaloarchaeota archaeon QJJ-9]